MSYKKTNSKTPKTTPFPPALVAFSNIRQLLVAALHPGANAAMVSDAVTFLDNFIAEASKPQPEPEVK